MKTLLNKTISKKEMHKIINQFDKNICLAELDGHLVVCPHSGQVNYRPDAMSFNNYIDIEDGNIIHLECHSGSGTHTITININACCIVVSTNGLRASYPGNGCKLFRGHYKYDENGNTIQGSYTDFWSPIININGWNLLDVSTSQPEWAVVTGWLDGKLGDGPAGLWEVNEAQSLQRLSFLKEAFSAIRKELPCLHIDQGKVWEDEFCKKEFIPRFTGSEYRRLYAMGYGGI